MNAATFDKILESRIEKMRAVLGSKAGEYASAQDRLHNFHRAAGLGNDTPAEAVLGMLRKHWVSLMDLAELKAEGRVIAQAVIDEKICDAANYLVLFEACLMEGESLP